MLFVHEASRIAEDDDLRSCYIRELVQGDVQIENTTIKNDIPKVIVQFWHDLDKIPEDVQTCINSWKILEKQGFKRVLFDDDSARCFISKQFGDIYTVAFDLCHHPAMRCDYFRLCYILMYGGVYVDADEIYQGTGCNHFFRDNRLKIQPLCYDKATDTMIEPDVFISKRGYSSSWIFYVNNNPLIAPANHPVIQLALNRATEILLSHVEKRPEIQSTTGPGNLTASLVKHSIVSKFIDNPRDFMILPNWENTSISPWYLSYRNDERNWRIWNTSGSAEGRFI